MSNSMRCLIISLSLCLIANVASAYDPDDYEYMEMNPYTGNLDATWKESSLDGIYLKLDCSDDGLAEDRQFLSPTDLTLHSAAQVINLSPTAAVTGQLDAIAVTHSVWFDTDETALAVYGNFISPIDHHKADYANSGWTTANSGRLVDGTFTAGTRNLDILVSSGDSILLGGAKIFDYSRVWLNTKATLDCDLTYYYYNTSSEWVQFYPFDSSGGLIRKGWIYFDSDKFTDWKTDYQPDATASTGYWIKVTRGETADVGTINVGTVSTYVDTHYYWDDDGDVSIRKLFIESPTYVDYPLELTKWASTSTGVHPIANYHIKYTGDSSAASFGTGFNMLFSDSDPWGTEIEKPNCGMTVSFDVAYRIRLSNPDSLS